MSKKYITIEDGTDFRRIAKIMTSAGFGMNHATARNQLVLAMKNLLLLIGKEMGIKLDKKQLELLVQRQDVHNILSDVLYLAYHSSK